MLSKPFSAAPMTRSLGQAARKAASIRSVMNARSPAASRHRCRTSSYGHGSSDALTTTIACSSSRALVSGKTGLDTTILGLSAIASLTWLFQIVPQRGTDAIHDRHANEDANQDGRYLRVFQYAQGGDELESDAACADGAEHRRGAKIIFPAVDRRIRKLRHRLRQHCVPDDLERGSA